MRDILKVKGEFPVYEKTVIELNQIKVKKFNKQKR